MWVILVPAQSEGACVKRSLCSRVQQNSDLVRVDEAAKLPHHTPTFCLQVTGGLRSLFLFDIYHCQAGDAKRRM